MTMYFGHQLTILYVICLVSIVGPSSALISPMPCIELRQTFSVCSRSECKFGSRFHSFKTSEYRMGMARRPNDDDTKQNKEAGKPESPVPHEVSDIKLKYLLLKSQLSQLIDNERYEEAKALKKEMDNLQEKDTELLACKLLNVSKKMQASLDETLKANKLSRLEHELRMAIAEEDYSKQELNSTISKAVLQRIDLVLLEAEIKMRVVKLKATEKETFQDPKAKLQHQLQRSIESEEYEAAHEYLQELKLMRMHHEKMKLSADRGKLLEKELTEAVNAERYEDAAQISKDLAHQEKLKMHDALQKQITENIAVKPQPAVSISASPALVETNESLVPLEQEVSDRRVVSANAQDGGGLDVDMKQVRSTSYFMIALTFASFFANLMIIGKAFQAGAW
ncbi:hypothetical protein GUITHDRAFT_117184 [Guillardia theta CCMP2712]|uniref:UVR domain-containing protein n=1 Tax=Guillardia theta (strain CCMP2712) TaxID=905079 RepID=L1IK71_GUITC|nr:hypothetical protein GUITHDRAFT_117184 [Guillardia theta CCMP2712]EKX36641.1 hypothetical protein GUITHDRAFT_117184 [Guillardia theta CCMP2712]|eukprot:XP_005823621.1 hypothetical protein GUITHDRAFT_117184 [Guillardia theta CCMP2712]